MEGSQRKMEGTLWKWTNYWSGWQPRWFILDDGVLAYYKSQEEVGQGCKGSIKMSVCEIIVHSTDNTRLDLVIPSEQHFYLKAATPQERQQWLVALGTAKANLSARQKKDTVASNPDILKTKKSELRLYCDLLMQQVHSVKSAATEQERPDCEKLNEATGLLEATCDTFIKTLEECMKLANANFSYELPPHEHITNPALPPSLQSNNFRKNSKSTVHRSNSTDRYDIIQIHSKVPKLGEKNVQESAGVPAVDHELIHEELSKQVSMQFDDSTEQSEEEMRSADELSPSDNESESPRVNGGSHENGANHENGTTDLDSPAESVEENGELDHEKNGVDDEMNGVKNFFSNIEISFLNLNLTEDGGIPSHHFIKSCAVVLQIFDLFRSPIFAPLKIDVQGNITKINNKYKKNPERFLTLQDIVLYEIETNTTTARNSATDALLWLKRGLEFTHEFLLEFTNGNANLSSCAMNAYSRTLKQYHGWIIRNVIMAASHRVPSRQEALVALSIDPKDVSHPLYEKKLMLEAKLFIQAMNRLTTSLNEFYFNHNLDAKAVV